MRLHQRRQLAHHQRCRRRVHDLAASPLRIIESRSEPPDRLGRRIKQRPLRVAQFLLQLGRHGGNFQIRRRFGFPGFIGLQGDRFAVRIFHSCFEKEIVATDQFRRHGIFSLMKQRRQIADFVEVPIAGGSSEIMPGIRRTARGRLAVDIEQIVVRGDPRRHLRRLVGEFHFLPHANRA